MTHARPSIVAATATVAALLACLGSAAPAAALSGDPVTGPAYDFVAKVDVGDGAAGCTGALVAPQWIITAKDCLPGALTATTVTVGRADLTGPGGHVSTVVRRVPYPDRDVVLAELATPATGVTPVPVATTAPAEGDALTAAGFGRTRTEWVPDRLHAASFAVTAVEPATLTISGSGPEAVICRGDAGGPAVRTTPAGPVLAALHHRSWQGGCLGETATRRDAVETRLDDLAGWIRQTVSDVTVFGATADGRLTSSAIDSSSGDRLGTVTSAQALGFTPKALATLNADTLLVTSTAGVLYRVDVTATDPALIFDPPVRLGTGWTHDRLSFDGDGSLFGIAGDTLRRYTVTAAKPMAYNIIGNTAVGTGFTLRTLTATGPDWIIGTTAAGALRSYHVDAAGKWTGYPLADTGWAGFTALVSPGDGLYYGRTAAGGLARFADAAPFDGRGTDIRSFGDDPVDTAGWDQALLSALPRRSFPRSPADVSVFGSDAAGHLTYTAIDSATGDRVAAVTSRNTLGFTPRAMAVLNFDTLLVTSTAGRLYRVDVLSATPALTFAPPTDLAGGWTHDLLAYDGDGSLFGIAAGVLHRYTVTRAKPVGADFTGHLVIGGGFTLSTLTATGPDWILGSTAAGALLSYRFDAAGGWTRYSLSATGWGGFTHLVSPGGGLYYGRTAAGGVSRFTDAAPFDGNGTDLRSFGDDPVDTAGWSQKVLSAQPFIA